MPIFSLNISCFMNISQSLVELMLLCCFQSFIDGRLAIDTHTHDLSAKTLRKTPSHGSLEMSPARSPPTVATMSTPMAPVLVPSMATAPIVAAPMGSAPLRLATVLPMTPMNGGQPVSFPKEVMSPSNVPKVGGGKSSFFLECERSSCVFFVCEGL